MNANDARARPWYREPWPWMLMAGPAVVIVACFFTLWLAVRSDDGLVVEDYYQRGLVINRVLGRNAAAERLGITAEIRLVGDRVRVLSKAVASGPLTLKFVYATHAGMDQVLHLALVQPGVYEGRVQPLRAGRWHVLLEQSGWRLAGDWMLPAAHALRLDARAPAPVGEEYRQDDKR
jgi:uncharacterized protein